MIKAVVFDFGGVLITPITRLLDEVAGWHDVTMVEMLNVLMGPREESTLDHPWHRAERGEIPTAVMQAEVVPFAQAAGLTLRGNEYDRVLCGEFTVQAVMIDRIVRLRDEGYRTGMLTNSFLEFRDHLRNHVDFALFDAVVDSSEVGCRKPEPEIYDLTTRRMGVEPHEIVYLDDFAANIDGAVAAGWHTVHVADPHQALAALDEILAG